MRRLGLALLALIAVGLGPAPAQDSAEPAGPATVTVTPIGRFTATASGQPLVLPAEDVAVAVSLYEIPAGLALSVHRHPYPRYAYMLSGHLRVTATETGATYDYGPGDFIIEVVGTWHFGQAIGDEPARLLVIDQVVAGTSNTELATP